MTHQSNRSLPHHPGSKPVACCIALWLGFLCLSAFPLTSQARVIIDMSGKRVTIPDHITKIFGVSPPSTYLIYAIDPQMIAGLNFPLRANEKRIAALHRQPVIGGLVGQGRTVDREMLLRIKPDFLLYYAWSDDAINRKFLQSLTPLNFPVVSVHLDSIRDYPEALRFLADIVGKKKRGKELQAYAAETLRQVTAIAGRIPEAKKVPVYYAEGTDGLSTEPAGCLHTELIALAGGSNVHRGRELDGYGKQKISMERLLLYDPDVIIVKEKLFFDMIHTDSRWQALRAVREHRVFLIPCVPFNWFDRPPSFMRLLGVKWLMHILHPHLFPIDMVAETVEFYKLFLGVSLSDQDARKILNQ